MTLALRYAVRSDVGLLREGNEDSAYASPRLLAVADGMGGHAAGEVASAVAIASVAALDGSTAPNGDLLGALKEAVHSASDTLHQMASADPAVEGMGTTLTAMLWAGQGYALCHIGDSRGYMLRDGELYQITHDHSLVQSLVDEGRLSQEEAATHPQRSLILRALDGRGEAEPDLSMRKAMPGDRYLLCSDGLSDVVSAETLHHALSTVPDLDDVTVQLIELAIRGGGPDNITVIVADVVDTDTTALAPTTAPVMAGAASHGTAGDLSLLERADSPAGRAQMLAHTAPQPAVMLDEPRTAPGGWPGTESGHPDDRDGRPPAATQPQVRNGHRAQRQRRSATLLAPPLAHRHHRARGAGRGHHRRRLRCLVLHPAPVLRRHQQRAGDDFPRRQPARRGGQPIQRVRPDRHHRAAGPAAGTADDPGHDHRDQPG